MFRASIIFLIFLNCQLYCQGYDSELNNLVVEFDGKYGQVEIGGNFVGAEFHHSRPLPSRISFYYPVANSIDLSTGYWERDQSLPFLLFVKQEGRIDTIGYQPFAYNYTPGYADFHENHGNYSLDISYEFCADLPMMILTVQLKNNSNQKRDFEISCQALFTLRTCHTYTLREPTAETFLDDGTVYLVNFDYQDTDSAFVFIANAGENSVSNAKADILQPKGALYTYRKNLSAEQDLKIIWLIGSGKNEEGKKINDIYRYQWQKSVLKDSIRIWDYAFSSIMSTGDSSVDHTTPWSKAVLAANMHYLNGQIVPMPCPAEYNFFFTHDALLTNLGAVNFDPARVKTDLLYLKSLTGRDSILPHAYYWKDGQYMTEYCGTDNWNHFWFIILTNSYLRHTRDIETVRYLFPILTKSINMVRQNIESDGLMYATRPDWWDIGHIYGAQTYVSLLMIRALQDYVSIMTQLDKNENTEKYIRLSRDMKSKLVEKLWNEEKGYLFNMIDSLKPDDHYYSGSLIAAAFNILDDRYKSRLLQSAEDQLLDENLGIRNAMPADFHLLTDQYKFQEGEVGAPFIYANGGVWPQGTIWYGMGLLEAGQVENSLQVLKKYLTLEGIRNSPNGQPSFYEYRNANFQSRDYGKIDKPTFLWAGGLYLYYLYHLAGVRENAWNIYLSPDVPTSFRTLEYDLVVAGATSHVKWEGQGRYFSRILWDGKDSYSAIVFQSPGNIKLKRGVPLYPYMAEINAGIESVDFDSTQKVLRIILCHTPQKEIKFEVISPVLLHNVKLNAGELEGFSQHQDEGVFIIRGETIIPSGNSELIFQF